MSRSRTAAAPGDYRRSLVGEMRSPTESRSEDSLSVTTTPPLRPGIDLRVDVDILTDVVL